jgi:predicted O-methyltransferase YrrM
VKFDNKGFLQKLKNYMFLTYLRIKEQKHILLKIFQIRKLNHINSFNLKNLIELTLTIWDGFIKPYQKKKEILEVLKSLKQINPKNILEIGTFNGGTLFLFACIASENAIIMSLDLPTLIFDQGFHIWKIPLYESFARKDQKIYLLRADSHKIETFLKVKKRIKKKKLDLLFIDGDHSYEGVKQDFQMYSPLVKKGGLIVFHDIVKHPKELNCYVHRFWNEIKQKYKYREIIESDDQEWAGIGVLYK